MGRLTVAVRRGLARLAVTLFLLCMLSPWAPAQEEQPGGTPAEPSDLTIKKRVDEVNLLFTVVDKKGRFVNQLQLDDFHLLDANLPPERIRNFQRESDLPLRVALVIDLSGSITRRFKFEQQTAAIFLKKILRPQTDKAMVIGFDDRARIEQDLTNDVPALRDAIRRMNPTGETALYDALVLAANHLRKNSELGTRRVIVLISDGDDNHSSKRMHEAQEAAMKAEVAVYTLSTNILVGADYTKGEAVLELLARYTGGELLPAHDSAGVTQAFKQVQEALRSQYVISYKPAEFQRNGSYRQIALTVRDRKLRVECRHGYFAPHE
jgi:VWFA-related protein